MMWCCYIDRRLKKKKHLKMAEMKWISEYDQPWILTSTCDKTSVHTAFSGRLATSSRSWWSKSKTPFDYLYCHRSWSSCLRPRDNAGGDARLFFFFSLIALHRTGCGVFFVRNQYWRAVRAGARVHPGHPHTDVWSAVGSCVILVMW